MPASLSKSYDLAIVGAGIFGLSIAYRAIKTGLSVIVLEKDRVGAGASGGLLGALMPHMPIRWNPKKEFQFQALSQLDAFIRELEHETGMKTGYRRCGRVLPLTSADKLSHHLERTEGAREHWHPKSTDFTYEVETQGSRSDWLSPQAAPFGLVFETLAARISPRHYLAALAGFVRQSGDLAEKTAFRSYDDETGALSAESLGTVNARNLIFASGYQSFGQISALTGQTIGRGEKGQALLLEGEGLETKPAIYCDGLYVVPHDNGTVAVGSTSDRHFDTADADPARSQELMRRAAAFCPLLDGRKVLDEWAGIRPRCNKRDALAGLLPGKKRTYAATGGFKISYGIAHLIAEALVATIAGKEPRVPLPPSYLPGFHFSSAD